MPWKKMTVFQLLNVLEHTVYIVNRRRIGVSNTMETIVPSDIVPVWSKVNPQLSLHNCSKIILTTCQQFQKNWEIIYIYTMFKQQKWLSRN